MEERVRRHKVFWKGSGPCLIFLPVGDDPSLRTGESALYDLESYPERFESPDLMRDYEISRAYFVNDWPTDGLPAVRPNLGTVFLPSLAGAGYRIVPGQMPWPGKTVGPELLSSLDDIDPSRDGLFGKAAAFYREIPKDKPICPYLPDTQGVMDLAHILRGDELLIDLMDFPERVEQWFQGCARFHARATEAVKRLFGEAPAEMIHGHGTPQGLFFPDSGTRLSEDSAILISPEQIRTLLAPAWELAIRPFESAFFHFCGYHPTLLDDICARPDVAAIDLGNPELYDTEQILMTCAQTNTVYYGRLASLEGENPDSYLRRLAGIVRGTGARVVLRPVLAPAGSEEAGELLRYWHDATA